MALFPKQTEKHRLLGHIKSAPRASLRPKKHTPQINERGEHATTGSDKRHGEHDSGLMSMNGAVLGKQPKAKHANAAPVHGASFHTDRKGNHAQSISPTQAEAALQGAASEEQIPYSPLSGAGKKLTPPKKHPWMSGADLKDLGRRIRVEK